MAKERQSNIELLRILAMLAIVFGHFASHGNWSESTQAETILLNAIAMGGALAVNVFVLITGYFTAKASFRAKSLFKVVLPTLFWCLTLGLLFLFLFRGQYSPLLIIQVPWFVVAFVLMFLFIPWMNYIAQNMSRRSYTILLVLGFLLLSLASSLSGSSFINSTVFWFLYLYMVGGFVGIHGVQVKTSHLVVALVLIVVAHTAAVALPLIDNVEPGVIIVNGVWTSRNSVTVFLMALLLLVLFKRADIGVHPLLNRIASASFGVYLISDNPFVRAWLWGHFSCLAGSGFICLIGGGALAALCIYVVCTVLELSRAEISRRVATILPGFGLARICFFIDRHYANVGGGNDA